MPTEREWANAEVVDGKVYVLGGEVSFHGPLDDRLVNAIEEYNPKSTRGVNVRIYPCRNVGLKPLSLIMRFGQ